LHIFLFLTLTYSILIAQNDIKTVHIGYDASAVEKYSKKDMKIATDIWLTKLLENIDYQVRFNYYDKISEMAEDLNNNKLDYVAGFGLNFVKHFDLSKLEDAFAQGYFDNKGETFVLLTHKDGKINSWDDIDTDTLIAVDKYDSLAKMYVKTKLYKHKNSINVNFLNLEGRNKAILKLFFNKTEVAISTNRAFALLKELNPQIGEKIKIMDDTQLTSNGFGFFRKNLDPKIKKELLDTTSTLTSNEYGKQLLAIYKVETLRNTTVEGLKPIQELYEKFQKIPEAKKWKA